MTERIFVYGILLNEDKPGEPASLAGYRLAFDGFATIEPAPGECVAGAALEVTAETILHRYDRIEGVDLENPERGFYRRERVTVETPTGEHEAWVYIKNRGSYGAGKGVDNGMVLTLHAGYLKWGLNEDLLEEAAHRARKEEPAWTP